MDNVNHMNQLNFNNENTNNTKENKLCTYFMEHIVYKWIFKWDAWQWHIFHNNPTASHEWNSDMIYAFGRPINSKIN